MSDDKKPAKPSKVTVYMIGASRGNAHGQRRMVDPETADRLVANGLASYPASRE